MGADSAAGKVRLKYDGQGARRVESRTLGELLADRAYSVPPEQRGYSWKAKNIADFMGDLGRAHAAKRTHQFGLIVSHQPKSKKRPSQLIDGQQRVTTALLFLIGARNFFFKHKEHDSAKRHLFDITGLLFAKRPGNGQGAPRLTLSKINDALFQKMLADPEFKKPARRKRTGDAGEHEPKSEFGDRSNKLLLSAYDKISTRFKTLAGNAKHETDFDRAYEHVKTLLDRFSVYDLTTAEHTEVYQIFQLINNRGVKLNPADHVKAYLLSLVEQNAPDEKITERYDETWKDISNNITNENGANYSLEKFLNHYLIINKHNHPPSVPSLSKLYDGFSALVEKGVSPESIMSEMLDWSKKFEKVRIAGPGHFGSPDTTHYLKKIYRMGAVYAYPVILGGHERYLGLKDVESFDALVSLCCKYHLRIMAIGRTFGNRTYERHLYAILKEIHDGSKLEDIIDRTMIGKHYPPDTELLPMLVTRPFTDHAHTVALLEEIEYSGTEKLSRDDATVEHVMPRDTTNWERDILDHKPEGQQDEEYIKMFHASHYDSLGNQTLLSKDNNIDASNKSLEDKLIVYDKEPAYRITRDLVGTTQWDKATIEKRQGKMAEKILEEIDVIRIRKRLEARSRQRP